MTALHAYLSSLPDGFRSFPGALCKGNVLDEQLEWIEQAGATLDPRLEEPLRSAKPFGRPMEWVPEVLINALSLNARLGYASDDAWGRALYDRQREVYQRPLYRALMMVMSPTLMTMAASDRWGAYRKGTSLAVDRWSKEAGRRSTIGTLTYPDGLYTSMLLSGLAQTLRSAIDAAGAEGSTVEYVAAESSPGSARYRMRYRS